MVCTVRLSNCLSVCHTLISLKLSEIDIWLLGNSIRNPGFPIQNLPSDSQSEVRFRHFGYFRVAFFDKLSCKDGTTLNTVAGQPSSCPITDDTSFLQCDSKCYLLNVHAGRLLEVNLCVIVTVYEGVLRAV